MKSRLKLIAKSTGFVLITTLLAKASFCQMSPSTNKTIEVGVAKIDITPETPIRLAGYGSRSNSESDGIIHRLEAKAMAFGSDAEHPSVLVTVDLIGITERITSKLAQTLSEKAGINPAQVVVCASHTHGGPEIGNLINILQYREEGGYTDSLLPLEQLVHIARYMEMLSQKLEDVSLAALKNRKPALVAWGQGQAFFAANRRTSGGPVDVAMPMLRVTNTDGTLKAVFLNYACHGTTLEGINEINADWIGEANRIIESNHPGCISMIALGCGADADPKPRSTMENVKKHGQEISDKVDKLLVSQLQPLVSAPEGKIKWVKLPFSNVPTVPELIKLAEEGREKTTLKAYYARTALDRIERGESIPAEVNLPVQVWNFGEDLLMVNLGGEVVVDYAIRLKNEIGAEHLWINAYSNDVPCYIASRRVIREGGYEADFSMYCYDKPSPLKEEAEDIIISAVHELIPAVFKLGRDTTNRQELIAGEDNGVLHLDAAKAKAIGPNIKYMSEWKAFGWFTTADQAEWIVNVEKGGRYEVYLRYSVSDDDAGKSFVLGSGRGKIKGKIGQTGSWFTYITKKIGGINLSAGTQKMVFKSNSSSETGAILDLAAITLVPVK
ncbi:MAG: neutral/alkaline non-lysosomal ceramidase N-terminal domain-containing protein [Chitinophagaceae bacterium]